jgi:hypothetical protein
MTCDCQGGGVMTEISGRGMQAQIERNGASTPGERPRKEPEAIQTTQGPRLLTRRAVIPAGSWPRRMPAEFAAGYCGETSVDAFLRRVGTEYPQPRVAEGRRRLWLRDDLDAAILPNDLRRVRDVAEDL